MPEGRGRAAGLDGYAAKRDFRRTPEPAPGAAGALPHGTSPGIAPLARGSAPPPGDRLPLSSFPRFVVQEHHARRLHWDLRLEADGVLKSWAVPKGIPERPGEKRLAVQVEDHPLDYMGFEGTIPAGNYGAGEVFIWDRGYYAPSAMNERKVTFAAMGERLNGAYKLVRMEGENWLLMMLADGRTDFGTGDAGAARPGGVRLAGPAGGAPGGPAGQEGPPRR